MRDRRKPDVNDPELREDTGLFGPGLVDVEVDVTPFKRTSSRGDLIFLGRLRGAEIEVVFPGRRRGAANALLAHLAACAAETGGRDEVLCRLRVVGTWRIRLEARDGALPQRHYQLLAARWQIDGTGRMYGAAPVSRNPLSTDGSGLAFTSDR